MLSLEKKIIRQLQDNIPLCSKPFKEIAERVGTSEQKVIALINTWLADGKIRRFGAVLRHQKSGFVANGMGVWIVADEEIESVGNIMAGFTQVSHCYYRPASDTWPYNLYTMIHCTTRTECEQVAREISKKTGIKDYRLLFSSKEFKKASMIYY